jgi:hypothetical protein
MACTMAPATGSIMTSLPMAKAGVGSAVNDTTRELGGSLGVAVLGSLVASRYTTALHHRLPHLAKPAFQVANSSLGAALGYAQRVGGRTAADLAAAARGSFTDGWSVALLVGAAVAVVAAAGLFRYLPADLGVLGAPASTPPELAADVSVEPDVDVDELEPVGSR